MRRQRLGGLAAHVVHPIPDRFRSTEDQTRSRLGAVALAVQTHPRLYDHARLDRLFGKDPAEGATMFGHPTRVLCGRYRLDRSGVVSRARAFEAKPGVVVRRSDGGVRREVERYRRGCSSGGNRPGAARTA